MQVLANAFDRDACLFDASASLALGPDRKEETEAFKRISALHFADVRRAMPRLARATEGLIGASTRFELLFCKARDLVVRGPARIFIFSCRPDARWSAGTVLILDSSEELTLLGDHYRNHFIGLAR